MDEHAEMVALLNDWLLDLRGQHKSPNTLKRYGNGVRAFLRWAEQSGTAPVLDRRTVAAFLADLIGGGQESSTVHAQQSAVRRFSAWLADEGEISQDLLLGMKPIKVDEKVVPELTEDEARALIAACKGKTFMDRRDEAIIRFMLETMARASECADMRLDETDVYAGSAVIRRGKGGKGRRVPFGPQTGAAFSWYLRMRRAQPRAAEPQLWLGVGNRGFAYFGLYRTLKKRAEIASLEQFNPHILRHTGAGRWLDKGGTEGGLMAVAGWSRREMIDRYVRSTSERRAAEEARKLNLGDL